MKCKICGCECSTEDLWLDTFCQECWEAECDKTWWEYIKSLSKILFKNDFTN